MAGPSAPQEPGSPGAGADDALDARLDRIGEALDRRKTEAAEAARRRSGPSSAGAMALGMRAMSELVAAVMVGAGMGWGLTVWSAPNPGVDRRAGAWRSGGVLGRLSPRGAQRWRFVRAGWRAARVTTARRRRREKNSSGRRATSATVERRRGVET
ncbi:MAG: hypothetical protein HZY79_01660 [Rhodoblastus sp.]|nr:MAG: hypothetical protein HZY79_01660 [Rhodoblastus sp.]